MPSTLAALLVFVLAVLPGALYTWAFEREAGAWGIGVADRIFRFIGASAVLQLLFAAPLYIFDSPYAHHRVLVGGSDALKARLAAEDGWRVFAAAVAYVLVPIMLGSLAASAVRRKSSWARFWTRVFAGRDPAPRAWDHLFSPRPGGVVRMRLKRNGEYVGGLFGGRSYAAGYPEEPQDIHIEETFALDESGAFVYENGEYARLGSELLIRWEEIEFLEFFRDPSEAPE